MIQRLQCVIRILKNRSHTVDNKNFEQQKVVTEEIPFEAEDWNPIDL